jgi:hypothetical protein
MIETDRASLESTPGEVVSVDSAGLDIASEGVIYETGPDRLDRTSLDCVPEGTGKKLYTIGCYTKEDWKHVHEVLMQDGTLEDNIPPSSIECVDEKAHSDTRGTYLLDDEEAAVLKDHPRVEYCHIDYQSYPGTYAPEPGQLHATPQYKKRFEKDVMNYRAWNTGGTGRTPPTSGVGATDVNRTGYQLYRHTQRENPWDVTDAGLSQADIEVGDHTIFIRDVEQLGDGTGVDAVICDDGFWIAHPEFVDCGSTNPTNWKTGNALTWAGISTQGANCCGVLDIIVDAPYYIDPDFFNANPSLLTTRWDGTTVPLESAARSWWSDSSQRSVGFSTIGTVSGISTSYTRSTSNGSNTAKATNGTNHGTQCASLVFGKNYGAAYNCNKWVMNLYGGSDAGIAGPGFDVLKLFHLYKPNYSWVSETNGRQQNGDRNPTLSSHSWGYRSTSHSSSGRYYWYRPADIDGGTNGTNYSGSSTEPAFYIDVGNYGDSGRMKGEHPREASYVVAGKEAVDAGVIFVVAAGNSNQTQVNPTDLDYNNYWNDTTNSGVGVALTECMHDEFGYDVYNTLNRRGWPQAIGAAGTGVNTIYPAINIGALDDQYISGGSGGTNSGDRPTDYKEKIVNYTDRGSSIDCYAAADDTLTADGRNSSLTYYHPETYTGLSLTPYDVDFGGTSAACPCAAGWITTKLQYNRAWLWSDIKTWLTNQCGQQNPSKFYLGGDQTSWSATDDNWRDAYGTNSYGNDIVVIWDAPTGSPSEPQKPNLQIKNPNGLTFTNGLNITFT